MRFASFLCVLIGTCLVQLAVLAQSAPPAPGLVCTASDGQRQITFVTPTPNFTLTAAQSIHPQLRPEFTAEWNGIINVLRGGKYTFRGHARIFLNGTETQGHEIQLPAGEQSLKLQFAREGNTPARLQLQWESEFFRLEPVPAGVLGHRGKAPELAAAEQLAQGRALVEELNCIACHRAPGSPMNGRRAPDLSHLGSRTSATWIFHWLENPQHFRASAIMPSLLNGTQESADVAAFLAGLKDPKADFKPAAGNPERIQRGKRLFEQRGCIACHDEDLANLDGLGSKMTAAPLAAYLMNPLAVDPSGRMPHLALTSEEAAQIAEYLVQSKKPAFEKPAPAGDAARGRELVAARGCLNCHGLNEPAGALKTALTAPQFKALSPDKGCLADDPGPSAARYSLKAEERASLAAYLRRPDISEAPVQDFHRLMSQFNCRACHDLYGPARLEFEVNQAPPPLTDAGNKLRESWLDAVLTKRKRVRPWTELRMPHYGPQNVKALVTHFAAQAGAERGEGEKIPEPSHEQIRDGIRLIGQNEGGLSCITCHDFRGGASGGEMRGPDLTEMDARIRADWMRRWLHDPGRIQPGTAMPAFFTEMPRAQADRMIGGILNALWAGGDMPIPEGLSEAAQEYLLLVKDEPLLLRTFLQDSSPRSIAVGLPGLHNFAFDAELSRFRYAWRGDFLDVKPVWAARGGSQAKILGQKYYTAPDSHPLRLGDPAKAPSVKFRGYRLVEKVPVFMYEVDGVLVREKITLAPGGNGLVRAFEIGAVKEPIWFLAAESPGVKITSSAGRAEAGRWQIPPGTTRFEISVVLREAP